MTTVFSADDTNSPANYFNSDNYNAYTYYVQASYGNDTSQAPAYSATTNYIVQSNVPWTVPSGTASYVSLNPGSQYVAPDTLHGADFNYYNYMSFLEYGITQYGYGASSNLISYDPSFDYIDNFPNWLNSDSQATLGGTMGQLSPQFESGYVPYTNSTSLSQYTSFNEFVTNEFGNTSAFLITAGALICFVGWVISIIMAFRSSVKLAQIRNKQ